MESNSKFEKQLIAFENMIKPLVQIKFGEKFFFDLQEEISIPKVPQKFSKEISINSTIVSIQLLRELSLKINKRINYSNRDKEFQEKLSLFLKQFQFAKSLKKYFDEKIYSFVYLHCYDAIEDSSQLNNNLSNVVHIQETFFLTEINLPSLKQINCKNNIIKSEKDMLILNERWNAILCDNNVNISLFEKDTIIKMNSYQTRLSLVQFIFYDLYLKALMSLKLIRGWIFNYKKIANINENVKDFSQYHEGIIKQINHLKINIQNQQDDIKKLENLIKTIKKESVSLKNKETMIFTSINNKRELVKLRDSLNDEYEEILAKRSSLLFQLNSSVYGTSKNNLLIKEIRILENLITEKFKELKIINYSVFLGDENSLSLTSTLKDYIRWKDFNKQIIKEREMELDKRICQKQSDENKLDLMFKDLLKMKTVFGSKMHDLMSSNNASRIVSSKTYTIERNDKYNDIDC